MNRRNKRTDVIVAIKSIDLEKSEDDIEVIQKEIHVLLQCSSPHVVSVYGSIVQDTKLLIVMEYLSGGSVLDLMKANGGKFEEKYIATIVREILYGLEYLHGIGLIHRDIKAANVLISDEGAVKLADLGVAGQLSSTVNKRHSFVGTPFWSR